MSYIKLPADKVKAACKKIIVEYEYTLKQRIDTTVNNYIGKRVWFKKLRTYDEALNYVVVSHKLPCLRSCCVPNVDNQQACKQLLTLANSGEPVTITHEHSFILEYLE